MLNQFAYLLLERFTANGNPYTHNANTGALENGHYIDLYVCEPELTKEWNRISRVPYDSLDRRGQPVSLTIRRYLTSKGLRKDSPALSKLNPADIQRIENGLANYRFRENPGLTNVCTKHYGKFKSCQEPDMCCSTHSDKDWYSCING